jgi:hypothetical protein
MDGTRALVVLAVLAARLAPRSLLAADTVMCPFRLVTGRPCPACGLTRSWSAATRLDVRESAAWHPLGIPMLVGALAVSSGVVAAPSLEGPGARRWAAAAAAIWVATWTVRFTRPPDRLRRSR